MIPVSLSVCVCLVFGLMDWNWKMMEKKKGGEKTSKKEKQI